MRRTVAPLLLLLVALLAAGPAHAVTVEQIGTAASPTFLTSEPRDGTRLYVVERAGLIRRLGAPGVFLDLSAQVSLGSERGLLSMAFAPDYATSGLLYVFHTDPGGDLTVAEYRRATAESADPASRRVVLVVEHSTMPNHNGGQLAFGPDGRLYISTGDGGGAGDPLASGQDLGSRLGKILRIDPQASGTAAYTVPADNPFAGVAGAAPEIWAYGLRNPWRFSFDRGTGDLVVADVGQGAWEEIDYTPRAAAGGGRGANFGWSCFEGRHAYNPCTAAGHVPPVFELSHAAGFCAITGGYVARDPGIPELAGRYVYGDYCQPALRSTALAVPDATGDRAEAPSVAQLASFGEDACGRVYALSLAGPLYRLAGASPTPCAPAR
jgi:glucose/arabinose dehydrogenase